MPFFLDLKEIGQKDCRSLTHMILPVDYQKGVGENKKNSTKAMNVIVKNPADCIFIIGKYIVICLVAIIQALQLES